MNARRPTVHLTLTAAAMAILDAEAEAQGISRSLAVELILRRLDASRPVVDQPTTSPVVK